MFRLARSPTRVRLLEGQGQSVQFAWGERARMTVTYNPQFADHETTLIPQRPDILIRVEEAGWPALTLLCDAKYRLDATPEFQAQFGSPGPPRDAINVLHRYRDAILHRDAGTREAGRASRCVIQAAAVFPLAADGEAFRSTRLWQSLARFGVGAVPALPSQREYLREWVLGAFREGGWALADRVIPHTVERRAVEWRAAAREPVLVGVLNSQNSTDRLTWILANRVYYHPLPKVPHRHFRVSAVALYQPGAGVRMPAITHVGLVRQVTVRRRGELATPWESRGKPDAWMVVYELDEVRALASGIENRGDAAGVFRADRWTSQLGLRRARTAVEIILETEPEWRLYEALSAGPVRFRLRADRVRVDRDDCPVGRAWFVLEGRGQIRWDGANGYLWQPAGSGVSSHHTLPELLSRIVTAGKVGG